MNAPINNRDHFFEVPTGPSFCFLVLVSNHSVIKFRVMHNISANGLLTCTYMNLFCDRQLKTICYYYNTIGYHLEIAKLSLLKALISNHPLLFYHLVTYKSFDIFIGHIISNPMHLTII